MGKINLDYLIYRGFKELIEDFMGNRKFETYYDIEDQMILKNFVVCVEYKNRLFKLSAQKSFSGDSGWDCKETNTNELIKKLEDEFEKFKEKVLKFDEINEMNFDELKEKYFQEMGLKKIGK
jgi:hypothetical protein|nr:MAG TPA: hypothetical protein [Caudoviricetes sp.]DAX51491.1 MAG TPA: hypothetical protein [Caudoviricetes sp.]